jgi:ATP-dependent Clp protease ATP-binding subunit ClpC
MFERYSEKARRTIFFARYEASQFGSSYIESEHLLLGLLREDRALARFVLGSGESIESIRKEIVAHSPFGKPISTSVELPLSGECARILTSATEEAKNLRHKHVEVEHLLLGIMREKNCFAAHLLQARGVDLETIRQRIVTASTPMTLDAIIQQRAESRRTLIEKHAKIAADKIVGLTGMTVDDVATIIAEEFKASLI